MLAIIAVIVLPLVMLTTSVKPAPLPHDITMSLSHTVVIDGPIGPGVLKRASTRMATIMAADPRLLIDVVIDTPGGLYDTDAEVLLSYMDRLVANGVTVRCTVANAAYSMGAIILSHCSQRYLSPTSTVLVHAARVRGVVANQFELETLIHTLQELDSTIWHPMRMLLADDTYFDTMFKEERRIPGMELVAKFPNVFTPLASIRVVE
jgi:ATP-dependent protease ClpP protease subunit